MGASEVSFGIVSHISVAKTDWEVYGVYVVGRDITLSRVSLENSRENTIGGDSPQKSFFKISY